MLQQVGDQRLDLVQRLGPAVRRLLRRQGGAVAMLPAGQRGRHQAEAAHQVGMRELGAQLGLGLAPSPARCPATGRGWRMHGHPEPRHHRGAAEADQAEPGIEGEHHQDRDHGADQLEEEQRRPAGEEAPGPWRSPAARWRPATMSVRTALRTAACSASARRVTPSRSATAPEQAGAADARTSRTAPTTRVNSAAKPIAVALFRVSSTPSLRCFITSRKARKAIWLADGQQHQRGDEDRRHADIAQPEAGLGGGDGTALMAPPSPGGAPAAASASAPRQLRPFLAGRHQLALADRQHAVGGGQQARPMGGEDHRGALRPQPAQQPRDLGLALRVERAGQLVQHQQPRPAIQRAGEGDAVPLAHRELPAAGQRRRIAAGQADDGRMRAGAPRRLEHLGHVRHLEPGDHLGDAGAGQQRLLRQVADDAAPAPAGPIGWWHGHPGTRRRRSAAGCPSAAAAACSCRCRTGRRWRRSRRRRPRAARLRNSAGCGPRKPKDRCSAVSRTAGRREGDALRDRRRRPHHRAQALPGGHRLGQAAQVRAEAQEGADHHADHQDGRRRRRR